MSHWHRVGRWTVPSRVQYAWLGRGNPQSLSDFVTERVMELYRSPESTLASWSLRKRDTMTRLQEHALEEDVGRIRGRALPLGELRLIFAGPTASETLVSVREFHTAVLTDEPPPQLPVVTDPAVTTDSHLEAEVLPDVDDVDLEGASLHVPITILRDDGEFDSRNVLLRA